MRSIFPKEHRSMAFGTDSPTSCLTRMLKARASSSCCDTKIRLVPGATPKSTRIGCNGSTGRFLVAVSQPRKSDEKSDGGSNSVCCRFESYAAHHFGKQKSESRKQKEH